MVNPAAAHGALESGRDTGPRRWTRSPTRAPASWSSVRAWPVSGPARALHDLGYDVTVVEGRERLGGRTFTDDSLGLPLDLGASWIHGVDGNPLSALADELGVPRGRATDWDNEIEHGPDGPELTDTLYAAADEALDAVLAYAAGQSEQREEDAPPPRRRGRGVGRARPGRRGRARHPALPQHHHRARTRARSSSCRPGGGTRARATWARTSCCPAGTSDWSTDWPRASPSAPGRRCSASRAAMARSRRGRR